MSYFDRAIPLEMYIRNVEAFEGQGEFLSKFGLEVRDRMTLTLARAQFANLVTSVEPTITRPREGDLVFLAMTNKLFEIMYVDNRVDFYPLGSLPMIDIQAEVFEYSNESFGTGISAIDNIQQEYSNDEVPHYLHDANNAIIYDANTGLPELDPDFDTNEINPDQVNKDIVIDTGKKFQVITTPNKFGNNQTTAPSSNGQLVFDSAIHSQSTVVVF